MIKMPDMPRNWLHTLKAVSALEGVTAGGRLGLVRGSVMTTAAGEWWLTCPEHAAAVRKLCEAGVLGCKGNTAIRLCDHDSAGDGVCKCIALQCQGARHLRQPCPRKVLQHSRLDHFFGAPRLLCIVQCVQSQHRDQICVCQTVIAVAVPQLWGSFMLCDISVACVCATESAAHRVLQIRLCNWSSWRKWTKGCRDADAIARALLTGLASAAVLVMAQTSRAADGASFLAMEGPELITKMVPLLSVMCWLVPCKSTLGDLGFSGIVLCSSYKWHPCLVTRSMREAAQLHQQKHNSKGMS